MPFGEDTQQEDTFLDVDTSDAVEPKAEPAGEHKIRVIGADNGIDKNQHPYFLPRFEIPEKPTSKDFTKFHTLPYDGMSEKDLERAKWNLDQFKKCFGLPSEGRLNVSEMIGLEGWAILGMKEDQEYGEQNYVRKYIAPK